VKLFGYHNVVFFTTKAEGDLTYFSSKEERDKALRKLRAQAIQRGLSESSARHGIYPVTSEEEHEDWP